MLREKIRKGNITIKEETEKNLTCYFCGRPINGRKLVLEIQSQINGNPIITKYSVDEQCYHDAQRYVYDSWGRMMFSLS